MVVTRIQILISYSTFLQTKPSQSKSFRDQNVSLFGFRRGYRLGQITWWIVMTKKMRGHSGKKIAHTMNGRGCGCIGTLKAQFCAILEPNANAQKMSLLSHLLRSLLSRDWLRLLQSLAQSRIGSPGTLSPTLKKVKTFVRCIDFLWVGASDIVKAKSSREDPRATGGLVSNFPHPRVNKTKQHSTIHRINY